MADRRQIEKLIQQADALATQGNWDGAIEVYQKALELDPEDIGIHDQIIAMFLKKGDYNEVINQHKDVAEIFQARGDTDAELARYHDILKLEEGVRKRAFALRGGNEEASQITNQLAQFKPEIFFRIGRIHLAQGRIDEALHHLRASVDLEPGRWDTHMLLGRAYMHKGMDKEAIGEFQEVVRLAPNEAAQAYEMLGEVFIRAGRPPQTTVVWFRNAAELYLKREQREDAIRTYERILAFEPHNKEVLVKLGEIYESVGARSQAVATYQTLAEIYSHEGLLDKVIFFYERLLECDPGNEPVRGQVIYIYRGILQRDPTNVSVRTRLIDNLARRGQTAEALEHQLILAQSHLERGMLEEAVSVARKLLEVEPGNIEARKLMGDIYRKKDMRSEALAEFQQVVRLYREQGRDEEALAFQQELVQMFPEASELMYQVALSLRKKGDHEGALRELMRLLTDRPDDLVARVYLAEELVELGRWDEAAEAYLQVLEQDPSRQDVRRKLIGYFLESGHLDAALGEIERLPQGDPEQRAFLHTLLQKLLDGGDLSRLEAELDRLPDDDETKLFLRKELVKRYLDAGDLERAARGMPLIPRSDRERNRLVTRLVELYMSQGQLETAAGIIHKMPAEDPLRLSFQRRLVASYLDAGRFEEGAAEMARLPEGDEARADFVSQLISGYLSSGQLDKARAEIEKLPQGDPARNSFMGQLIEAFLSAGDIDRATREVAGLPEGDQIRPRYRRRIIQALLNASRLDEAEADIFGLDDRDPEKRSFLRMLIQKYETLGRLDKVRDMVMQMPDDMEEKQHYMHGLVHNFLGSGDLVQARQEIYRMAETVSAQGNHQEAERLYRELLAYHPTDVEIRLRLAQEIAAQGQLERAREGMLVLAGRFHKEANATSAADIYTRLLAVDSGNLNARYRLGQLWAEQGQKAQALEQFAFLARVYLDQNLPEAAQRVLGRILELDPKDIPHRKAAIGLLTRNLRFHEATEHYRVLLGIHLERGELDEARACVDEIINLQPLNLELRQTLGEMFLRAGFLEEGQKLLEDLASTFKGRGEGEQVLEILGMLSRSFEENQQWETALEYRERMADELVELDRWGEAQEQYLSALEQYLLRGRRERTDPIFVKLIDGFFRHRRVAEGIARLERLEETLSDAGRPALALVVKDRLAGIMERLNEWDRALELVEAISNRYLHLGDVEAALSYRRRAADLALSHDRVDQGIEHLFTLAQTLVEHRGLDSARPVLNELKRSAPDDVRNLERIGDILFAQGLFEEARPIYHEVLEKEPGRAEALSRVAIIYAREGRLEEAAGVARQIFSKGLVPLIIDEYCKAVHYSPDDPGSHIRLGQFYRQMGFLEEAISEFQKAARDPGKLLVAFNHLALCFKEQGYRELAIRQLQRALEQPGYSDDELLETRFHLGQALEEEGRLKEALQAYQECYAVDIRYRDVAERIDRIEQMQQAEQRALEAPEEEPEVDEAAGQELEEFGEG